MPELAEADFYRKKWDQAKGQRVLSIQLHQEKRVFRSCPTKLLQTALPAKTLEGSRTFGKKIVFTFSDDCLLGIHLGMSGELNSFPGIYLPQKHDHLVLQMESASLIFTDPRMFGQVLFYQGSDLPEWFREEVPSILSSDFNEEIFHGYLVRHKKTELKKFLLNQKLFPGIGNWMADEILWQSRLHPARTAGSLRKVQWTKLYQKTREICQTAMDRVSENYGDLPENWIFHQRWKKAGICPQHKVELKKTEVGGRTSAWCPKCQAPRKTTV